MSKCTCLPQAAFVVSMYKFTPVIQGNSSVPFKTVKTGLTISVSIHSCDEWENCWLPFCWANSLTSVLTTTHTHTHTHTHTRMHVCTFHIASTICNAHTLFSCILLSTLCLTRCPQDAYTTYPWTTSALGAMHTHHKRKEERKGLEEGGPFLFVSTLHIANTRSNAHSLLSSISLNTLCSKIP